MGDTIPDLPPWPDKESEYELKELIGIGAFAHVYAAYCIPRNEKCAIKVIDIYKCKTPTTDLLHQFKMMSTLIHPNLVTYYAFFTVNYVLCLVSSLLEGGSLRDIINYKLTMSNRSSGIFDEATIATVLKSVLKGLQYLHKNGQSHRDIRAGNILIDDCGSIKITDFGLTACFSLLYGRDLIGSPCWMAPEVMNTEEISDSKADIWSVGIAAIEMATGNPPYYKYSPMKVVKLTLLNDPPNLDTGAEKKDQYVMYGKTFRKFIAACLNKDPAKRPSVAELLLHPFLMKAKDRKLLAQTLVSVGPSYATRVQKVTKRKSQETGRLHRPICDELTCIEPAQTDPSLNLTDNVTQNDQVTMTNAQAPNQSGLNKAWSGLIRTLRKLRPFGRKSNKKSKKETENKPDEDFEKKSDSDSEIETDKDDKRKVEKKSQKKMEKELTATPSRVPEKKASGIEIEEESDKKSDKEAETKPDKVSKKIRDKELKKKMKKESGTKLSTVPEKKTSGIEIEGEPDKKSDKEAEEQSDKESAKKRDKELKKKMVKVSEMEIVEKSEKKAEREAEKKRDKESQKKRDKELEKMIEKESRKKTGRKKIAEAVPLLVPERPVPEVASEPSTWKVPEVASESSTSKAPEVACEPSTSKATRPASIDVVPGTSSTDQSPVLPIMFRCRGCRGKIRDIRFLYSPDKENPESLAGELVHAGLLDPSDVVPMAGYLNRLLRQEATRTTNAPITFHLFCNGTAVRLVKKTRPKPEPEPQPGCSKWTDV